MVLNFYQLQHFGLSIRPLDVCHFVRLSSLTVKLLLSINYIRIKLNKTAMSHQLIVTYIFGSSKKEFMFDTSESELLLSGIALLLKDDTNLSDLIRSLIYSNLLL